MKNENKPEKIRIKTDISDLAQPTIRS